MAGAILTSIIGQYGDSALFDAVHTGFIFASGIAVIGALVSYVRGIEYSL